MDLQELVDIIDTMIVEHDYPGFEPRALNLSLPQRALAAPAKVFGQALHHDNIFVQLAALRWFQARPGLVKSHSKAITALLESDDSFVRAEAIKTMERAGLADGDNLTKLAAKLKDSNEMVRKAAAKAAGKLFGQVEKLDDDLLIALREAALDPDEQVRWKAQKALRKLGAYSSSSS
jgi:hypothetical protein